MTSRETTSFLSRSGDRYGGRLDDLAKILAFGLIQWPWLLRSLWGGWKRDKVQLLARLDLPADALPNLGSWKADTGLLHQIVDRIAASPVHQVVELGSGASTLVIAKALALYGGGKLTSYDQHPDFIVATKAWLADHDLQADLLVAPLEPPPPNWGGRWYGLSQVPMTINLLVIDGPHWTLNPMVRGAAEILFDRIPPGGTIMLDDAARPGERVVAARWKRAWPQFDWEYRNGIKGTLIGTRR